MTTSAATSSDVAILFVIAGLAVVVFILVLKFMERP